MVKVPELVFPAGTHPTQWEFYDWMRVILNNGRYQLRIVTAEPNWVADDGEMVLWNDEANDRKYLYMYITDGWYNVTFLTKAVGGGTRFHNVGEIFMWGGGDTSSDIPGNTIVCNGAAVSRTTYSELFTIISTSFGSGDGATTFNVPDLRGRFSLGKDNMGGTSANRVADTDADSVGGYGGSSTSVASHVHNMTILAVGAGPGVNSLNYIVGAATANTGAVTTGGETEGNLPPFVTVVYLIQA